MTEEASFLGHEACPKCGSDNNLGRWSDGHAYCFGSSCDYREPSKDGYQGKAQLKVARDLLPWRYPEDMLWGVIDPEVAKSHRYGFGTEPFRTPSGKTVKGYHIANYYNREGEIVAQKLRFKDKGVGLGQTPDANYFPFIGKPKDAVPLGFQKWRKGKRLVIVEGEKDFLSMCQLMENKWPVWSLINGAQSASRDLLRFLPELEDFEQVILMLDADEAGQAAQAQCAEKLMGSVNVLVAPALPLKDVTDMLVAGRGAEVIRAFWNASQYRPKQIVSSEGLLERLQGRLESGALKGHPYPWEGLNGVLRGARAGEIVTVVAGSGTGKSTVLRHLLRHFHESTPDDEKAGAIFLEEDLEETFASLLSIGLRKNIMVCPEDVSRSDLIEEDKKLFGKKSIEWFDLKDEQIDTEKVLSQIRYMAKGLGCKYIFLDHLSFIVGGMAVLDERKAIDIAMTALRRLVKSTNICLFLVVHLKRPDGNKGYDEGLKVSTNFIRGSQSIEQLSNIVLALQRNKRDETLRDYLELVVLKNRFSGQDGLTACWLKYDMDQGTLTEVSGPDLPEDDTLDTLGEGDVDQL